MEMVDDELAFSARCLRAKAPAPTGDGNDETFAQISQYPSSVVVKHIRNISVITSHVLKEREDDDFASTSANDDKAVRQNIHKEVGKSRRAENIVYERGSRCRTSRRRKPTNIKTFFVVMILLSIVSMVISGYVSYCMIIQPLHCNCTLTKALGTSRTTVNVIKPERLKEILVKKINKLKKQLEELQNSTEIRIDVRCKKTTNECQTELIDNLTARYSMAHHKMELLFNTTKERMNSGLEIVKIRRNERMNFIVYKKETLMQMNMTFLTKCTLKHEIQSGNQSFVMTQVPQKTENFVTVGITCSTSAENAPKYFYLRQPTKDDDSYTCCCQNDDNDTKRIDCIAYYWQCKVSHHN